MCVCVCLCVALLSLLSLHCSLFCVWYVYKHTCLQHGSRYPPKFARGNNPGENKFRCNAFHEQVPAMKRLMMLNHNLVFNDIVSLQVDAAT